MASVFLSLYRFFGARKGLFALCCLVVAGISVFLVLRTHFEEDISKIMPSDAGLKEMNDLLEHSDLSDRIVIRISRTDTTGTFLDPEVLIEGAETFLRLLPAHLDTAQIREITARVDESQFTRIYDILYAQLPMMLEEDDYAILRERTDPDSLGNHLQGIYHLLMTPGGSFVKNYVMQDPLSLTPLALERLQRFRLDENFELYDGYVVTQDYKNLILFVTPKISSRESRKNAVLVDGLNTLTEEVTRTVDSVDAEYFGAAMVAVDNAVQVQKDVTLTVSIAILILSLLILYFFRSPRIFVFLMLPTLLGGLVALGILGSLRESVSIIAIGIGSILLGITIDYALHIFTHLRSSGDRPQAIRELVWPILVSSITTAAAFACLFIVRSDGLHDLGAFAALSVICTAVFALVILPLLPIKLKHADQARRTFIDIAAEYPLHRKNWVLWTLIILTILCATGAGKVAFEDDLYKINFTSQRTADAERHLNELTSATHRGVYLASSGRTLDEALVYERGEVPLLDSLKAAGMITQYAALSTLIPSRAEQEDRIRRWEAFWSEERKQEFLAALSREASALGFKADAFNRFETLLNTQFSVQPASVFRPIADAVLPGYISGDSTRTTVLSLLSVDTYSAADVYPYFDHHEHMRILDKGYLVSRFVDILRKDFQWLVLLSFFLVFFILHMALGRLELSLITFLPVSLSWIWTLGAMHYFGLKFNIINVIITSFIFGLGIDYSIFIIRGLQQEYQYGLKRLKTYKTSVLLSVITTLTGIGVLIIAKHPALRSISLISIIGIISVVLFAFALQPRFFRWLFYRSDGKRREYPLTLGNVLKTLAIYGILAIGTIVVTILALIVRLVTLPWPEAGKLATHWMIWQFSRLYIWLSFFPHYRFENPHNETFKTPAVIIANHHAHIDTTIMFSLTPKLVILTKDWVRRFPLYYLICRLADFYTVSEGLEGISSKLQKRVAHGYHICVFPEGSRSETDTPKRFHKGAFVMADAYEMDILPVYLHGTGRYLRKGSFWGQSNDVTVRVGKRISFAERQAAEMDTKAISRDFKGHYQELRDARETCYYHRRQLIENYLYKGPVLEWYLRVKLRLENYYAPFDAIIPRQGFIVDLGCGYGFLDYMLHFRSPERRILGVDYDEQKILTAQHCPARDGMLDFVQGDVTQVCFDDADAIIISDVLHYLFPDEQMALLDKCVDRLKPDGLLVVRDGNKDLEARHRGTQITEWFSTNFGFNQTRNPLHYVSGSALTQWAESRGLMTQVIDTTRLSSNVIYCFSRKTKDAPET